jgi:hypothetical protein
VTVSEAAANLKKGDKLLISFLLANDYEININAVRFIGLNLIEDMLLHSSPPSTWACADTRSPATVDQGHQIWLNSVELMRRVVKKTDPTFPMLDGGRLRGTVKLDVLIDRTGKWRASKRFPAIPSRLPP